MDKTLFSLPVPQLDNDDVDLVAVLDSTDKSSLETVLDSSDKSSLDTSQDNLFFIGTIRLDVRYFPKGFSKVATS